MREVERVSRRFLAWAVTAHRGKELFESLVDSAPVATNYYSDHRYGSAVLEFSVWMASWYPGQYTALPDKSQTYSVEGDNAELRHYLARLGRSNRCFSRCVHALRRAIDLFVRAWNARQSFKRQYPKLPAHVKDFLPQ